MIKTIISLVIGETEPISKRTCDLLENSKALSKSVVLSTTCIVLRKLYFYFDAYSGEKSLLVKLDTPKYFSCPQLFDGDQFYDLSRVLPFPQFLKVRLLSFLWVSKEQQM